MAQKTAQQPPKGGSRVGRGTRWTEEQVAILMDAVKAAASAKEGFERAAKELGKNVGTVQQKYYNLQKQLRGDTGRRGSTGRGAAASGGSAPRRPELMSAAALRMITIDELGELAHRVREEIERRKQELDVAEQKLRS